MHVRECQTETEREKITKRGRICHKICGRKNEISNTKVNRAEINKLCRKKGKNMCRQKVESGSKEECN